MTKAATIWRTDGFGEQTADNLGIELTTQAGVILTTQTLATIVLSDGKEYPKDDTVWATNEAKVATGWRPDLGLGETSLAGLDIERITEAGETRVTEAADTRTLEDGGVTYKAQTAWTDNDD